MKTLFARLAGLRRRTRIMFAAAGVLLLAVIVAGVVVALTTRSATPPAGLLAGEATGDWRTGLKTYWNGQMCLSTTTEYLAQPGKYQARLWPCEPDPLPANMVWTFVAATGANDRGAFMKSSAGGAEVCLDVEGGEAKENATVTTFACRTKDYANQLWNVNAPDSWIQGGWTIESGRSGLCLSKATPDARYAWVKLVYCSDRAVTRFTF